MLITLHLNESEKYIVSYPRYSDKQLSYSLRLKDYDYSTPGAYFITLCTNERIEFFGEVIDGEMHLSKAGEMARDVWETIPNRFPHMELDHFVVMPNHLHGIIIITEEAAALNKKHSILGQIMRTYKAATTANIRHIGITEFAWQKNYYEHVIRTDYPKALDNVRQYIENNPSCWNEDDLYG